MNELVSQYRELYQDALHRYDEVSGELIQSGREAAGLEHSIRAGGDLVDVHEGLLALYGMFFNGANALEHFGSQRYRNLDVELYMTRSQIEDRRYDLDLDPNFDIDGFVYGSLVTAGYGRDHWSLKPVFLAEMDYMLDILEVLVEPDWVPGSADRELAVEGDTEAPDRHIPTRVKVAVWRRDRGKCVQCESQTRLEYDHMIPVSKGGSNTERNIQLLCQKCNREKSASIA